MKIDRIIKIIYKLTGDRLRQNSALFVFNLQQKNVDKYFIIFFN